MLLNDLQDKHVRRLFIQTENAQRKTLELIGVSLHSLLETNVQVNE